MHPIIAPKGKDTKQPSITDFFGVGAAQTLRDILMDLMLLYDITPAEKASLDLNKLEERLVSSIWKYDMKHGLTSEVQKIVQENYAMCFV